MKLESRDRGRKAFDAFSGIAAKACWHDIGSSMLTAPRNRFYMIHCQFSSAMTIGATILKQPLNFLPLLLSEIAPNSAHMRATLMHSKASIVGIILLIKTIFVRQFSAMFSTISRRPHYNFIAFFNPPTTASFSFIVWALRSTLRRIYFPLFFVSEKIVSIVRSIFLWIVPAPLAHIFRALLAFLSIIHASKFSMN